MKKFKSKSIIAALLIAAMAPATGAITSHAEAASKSRQVEQVLQHAPELNFDIVITGDSIRLGDIFQNAGKSADKIVARAPKPGKKQRLSSAWLARVAKFYDLDWKPLSRLDEAIVTREAYQMDAGVVTDAIRNAIFQETGEDDLIEIQLSGRLPDILLPIEADMTIALNDFRLTSGGSRFTASFTAPASGEVHSAGRITGKIYRLVEVAMPARRLKAGDIIREDDLEIITLQSRKVTRKALVHPEDLIGKQIKRTLVPGRPVLPASVQEPVLVKKKSLVTVKLRSFGMQLTAQATALTDGTHKEVIQVKNTQSGQVLEAVVTGPNIVEVNPALNQSALRQ